MSKFSLFIITFFSISQLYAQNRTSLELRGGGGYQFVDYNSLRNTVNNQQGNSENYFMIDALLSMNYYTKNKLNMFSIALGNSWHRISKTGMGITSDGEIGETMSITTSYLGALDLGYRRFFSSNFKSRFFFETRFALNREYRTRFGFKLIQDDVVVEQNNPTFQWIPAGQATSLFRTDINFGYSVLLSTFRGINNRMLFLNMAVGATFFPTSEMIMGTFSIGFEYRFKTK